MKQRNSHTWLFAFTDLAFLLLISLSLVPSGNTEVSLHLATIDIPTVPQSRSLSPVEPKRESWELRILPVSEERTVPYQLAKVGTGSGKVRETQARNLSGEELIPALQALHRRGIRPTLLPEKRSLSQDFLFAAGALARVWESESQTMVRPVEPGDL